MERSPSFHVVKTRTAVLPKINMQLLTSLENNTRLWVQHASRGKEHSLSHCISAPKKKGLQTAPQTE